MGFLRSSHAKKRAGKRPGPNAIPFQQSAQRSPSDGQGKSGIEGQVGEGGKVSGAGVFRRKEAGKGEGWIRGEAGSPKKRVGEGAIG